MASRVGNRWKFTLEGRECELLYKKKTLDGFVVVKYEDGTEEEVPAEDVTLNRIIEA